MSAVATEYIELGLRLGRHVENLVDSYNGPKEISERVEAEELREPASLVEDAVRLREAADEPWLEAQLGALEAVARKLAGEDLSYEQEVERYYGIPATRVPEEELEEAHRRLDAALPGKGSLAERYQGWRERDTLSGMPLARVVGGLAGELRSRTAERFGLPDGESVDWEFVTDEPGPPTTTTSAILGARSR